LKLIDLSQTIEPGMSRFQGFADPEVKPVWTHKQSARSGRYEGCTCEVTRAKFVTSIGTYLDAPYHFDPEGEDISGLALEGCVLEGMCVDVRPLKAGQPIGVEPLAQVDCTGKAVLLCTGWSKHWGMETYQHHPFLARTAVGVLLRKKPRLVGIDTLVIDDPGDPTRPAHANFLKQKILIVENLTNLESLIDQEFTFIAVPPKVKGAAAFPVRAFAWLPTDITP